METVCSIVTGAWSVTNDSKKTHSSLEVIVVLMVCLIFVVPLDASQTIRCTSPLNDPKVNKNCEKQCRVKELCPSFCNCKWTDGNNSCDTLNFAPDKLVSVREDVPAGTNILSIEVRGPETWTFSLGRSNEVDGSAWTHLKSYLAFKRFGKKYELIVNKTLDLEYIFQRNSIRLSTLILILGCKLPGSPQEKTELLLQILPVNEFSPQFIGAPFHLSIPEDTSIGTQLITLEQVTVDRDVNPYTKELGKFGIYDYLDAKQRDGQSYFGMDDVQKGIIVLKNDVDFEALSSLGAPIFVLNVSASDVNGLRTFTEVQINVTDVDDLPPEFVHPSCPLHIRRLRPCPVSFEANVPIGYKGPIRYIRPQEIRAHDMDALDAAITYSLYSGPGEFQANVDKFYINETSGMLSVISPFLTATHVDLVVVASENTTKRLTTQAPLKIIVDSQTEIMKGENPISANDTHAHDGSSKGQSESRSQDDHFLFLGTLIGLAALTLILFILIIILLLKNKQSGRSNSRVYPANHSDDEYDQPTSYHFSQDDSVRTKTTQSYSHLPESNADTNKGNNHLQEANTDTESQLTSKILSSVSQPTKGKAPQVSQAEKSAVARKKLERFSSGDGRLGDCNKDNSKKSESNEGNVRAWSDESTVQSSPELPLHPSNTPNDGNFRAASLQHDTKRSHIMSIPVVGAAIPHHKVHKRMSCIEALERGSNSAVSLKTRAHTDPITYDTLASKAFDRTDTPHRLENDSKQKSRGTPSDKTYYSKSTENPKLRHRQRVIRIPSGVLIMHSSSDDNAIDQSGEDSNDSTLNDEPMIDIFCESPDTSLFGSVTKESATPKTPNGTNVLSLLPEHQLSESDPNEVITKSITKSSVPPPLKTSRRRPKLADAKAGRSTSFQPRLWNASHFERDGLDIRSQSQSAIGIESKSVTANPSDERAATSMRCASEVENVIRRKKKRRRDPLGQLDRPVTSLSKSQGDDGNVRKLPDIKGIERNS